MITPAMLSITTSSGSSKLTPKISSSAMRKLKYDSPVSAVVCTSLPMVSRNASPWAITK